MDTKQALIEKLNTIYDQFRVILVEMNGDVEKVDKWAKENENNSELIDETVMRAPEQYFDTSLLIFNCDSSNNPEGIKNRQCKEEYLSFSEIDRRLFVAWMKACLAIRAPYDTTHGNGDRIEQKLADMLEVTALWDSSI